ncbi:MAG TPA: SDR family oxidoreductase [Kofleriaceae bacterium]|nr:SDR family oxidoreductase [Kofleriaceae bacterium]
MRFKSTHWALILGGSSGFGLATAKRLASSGMNIAVVHRDRRGAMRPIEVEFEAIRATGVGLATFNVDALADTGRAEVLDALAERMGDGRVRLLMHSIAFGNLKLVAPIKPEANRASAVARARLAEQLDIPVETLTEAVAAVFASAEDCDALATLAEPPAFNSNLLLEDEDYARTVHSMGTSMSTWTQDVFRRKLFAEDARVLGMTSEGNEIAWRGYAAVAAAKVAMESVSRAIAVEFAPYGIRSNIVQAGVTPTRALALIPGSAQLKASARLRNPFGRLTTPEDVADVIALLCTDEAQWINGTIIRADGGEHIGG